MTESRREMALRHVLYGRRIVAAQRLKVERLREEHRDAAPDEELLTLFERSLAIFETDLAQLDSTN
jgi:hypothetical protein